MAQSAKTSRFPWLALLFGLLVGLAAGLYYAWILNPVQFVNVSPRQLSLDDQQEFVRLVAEAYLQDGDVDRARNRLSGLEFKDVVSEVTLLADSAYLRGGDAREVRSLTTLAEALGGQPLAAELFSGTGAPTTIAEVTTPTPTATTDPSQVATPTVTPQLETPTPTLGTPSPTPDLFADTEFELIGREEACIEGEGAGYIEVYVWDEDEEGIPAIEVLIEWGEGQDTLFTGLKPAIDPGYGDFLMEADQVYSVTLVGLGEPVLGLDSGGCETPSGRTSIPTYRLTFGPAGALDD